jgi:hypothetical protein
MTTFTFTLIEDELPQGWKFVSLFVFSRDENKWACRLESGDASTGTQSVTGVGSSPDAALENAKKAIKT